MKAKDFLGQEIERIQRAAMGPSSNFKQVAEAQKMMALASGYSAAQDFLNLENRWKNEVQHLTRAHLTNDHISSYKTGLDSLLGTNAAFEAAKRLNENADLVSALSSITASLGSVAATVENDFEETRRHLREQLGVSTAQTLSSALASERDIATLKGYSASTVAQAWERDAMASAKGLQTSFALARVAGVAGIEKALANSIESIASQFAGQLNVKDRLREMVQGMSTFDLATTASLARYHGVAGLARQMAALGLEPSEYFEDENDNFELDAINAKTLESEHSALSETSLDVFRQLLINIIAAYIWALFLAPSLPNPDLDTQNKKMAKIESLIQKLPQLIESQVNAIVRRQLFAVETFFVVKERTARLRTSPEAGAGVLAVAFPNQKLKLLEERGKWIRVEFYDYLALSMREGWVLKKYCNRLPTSVNSHESNFQGRELDAALAQSRDDLAAGRMVQESPAAHLARLDTL